ncbi:biotin/lipoyl-containing protein, partial [Pseudomonas aeruginosa]|uniref:biotin/lipoyl-containing protein n=1 Tax=Pseudomonas aeruginosa TaxID=287 RepID=UPI0029D41C11
MKHFKLPDLGEGLQEAEIVEWHVKAGDSVRADQRLVSVETAKALVDIPAPYDGVVGKLFGAEGDILHVGEPLVGFEGEEADAGTVVGRLEGGGSALEDRFFIGAEQLAHHPIVGRRDVHQRLGGFHRDQALVD